MASSAVQNSAIHKTRHMDGVGPGALSVHRPHLRMLDSYRISVFTDILEFANYLEGHGIDWTNAARYALENEVFIVPSENSSAVLGIYTKNGVHGILELYSLDHPGNLDAKMNEMMGRVENVRGKN